LVEVKPAVHTRGVTASTRPVDPGRTVGEVAAEAGVAASAVRFYEQNGVVTAYRTAGNQRRFDDSAACRIRIAKVAQRVGLTVREIADVFTTLPPHPQPEDWHRIADILVDEAERRVTTLRTYLAGMRSDVRLCELDDALADSTRGPRS
jgi:MerR family redox-sensitive transcriptional activator SoxR